MNLARSWTLGGILAALAPAGIAATAADVKAGMDRAASQFQRMSASVKRTTHTAVLNEDNVESGQVYMRRDAAGAVQGLVELTNSDHEQKFYAFEKRTLRIYTPQINTIQVFDLGQHGEQLDQFLSIGFGTSGKELAGGYDVDVAADNTVPNTTRIKLTPKVADVKQYLTRIDLWITDGNYPIQEKLWEPSGDWILVNYSNVRINPALSPDVFTLHPAPGAKTEYPQK
jgi:outer membrane lipoprotein-sorting protein